MTGGNVYNIPNFPRGGGSIFNDEKLTGGSIFNG